MDASTRWISVAYSWAHVADPTQAVGKRTDVPKQKYAQMHGPCTEEYSR